MHNKNGSQRLVGEVQMLRIRVAASESKLKLLQEQARQAKRRRKEAKRMAQRARKQFKRGKADVVELRQALAKAEAKFFQAGGRALARKMAKARLMANRSATPSKKSKNVARRPRSVSPRGSRVTGRVTREKAVIMVAKVVPEGPVDVAIPDLTPSTPSTPGLNS